jgi:glycogen synthase
LRILLVNYEYPPAGGGAGNATLFMARALVELGHTPIVLTATIPGLPPETHDTGIRVLRVRSLRKSVDRSNPLEMFTFLVAALWRAARLARPSRIEGVIAFFTIPCGPVGWLLHRIAGIPYIVSLRGGDVPGHVPGINLVHHLLAPVRRMVLRRASAVVANAPGLAQLSERTDPVPVRVVPNGVDPELFRPPKTGERAADGAFIILYVGRLHEEKNLDLLLGAIATLRQEGRDVRLVLGGNGPEQIKLAALSRSLSLEGAIDWLGWQAKGEVPGLYRRADCFVNPSRYEGLPNAVLEAMASGLPVVASDVGGNNDLVHPGETGFLFDLTDTDGLRRALARLHDDPALRSRMGDRGRTLVASNYSWLSVAASYLDLLGHPEKGAQQLPGPLRAPSSISGSDSSRSQSSDTTYPPH